MYYSGCGGFGGATAERSGILVLVLYYNCVLLGKRRERERERERVRPSTASTHGVRQVPREPRSLRAYYIGVL